VPNSSVKHGVQNTSPFTFFGTTAMGLFLHVPSRLSKDLFTLTIYLGRGTIHEWLLCKKLNLFVSKNLT
jgi:hypothetical protein